MTKSRVAPKRPTPAQAPTPPERSPIDELLWYVEDRCNRAVQIINVTERAIGGAEMHLYEDDDFQRLVGASLEQVAADLTTLSNRALAARTGGAA